ncbi:MAG: FHA domain-containing protein [Anaerolineales bacterium]
MPFFPRSVLRVLPIFFLISAVGLALPAEKVRSQGTATTLQIVKLDTSAFPEIRVQVLMLDPNGATAAIPSNQNLTLSENSRSVEFAVEQKELGAEIGFLMDAGTGLYSGGAGGATRLQEMKDAIQELTQDPLLLTGKDVFYVVAQEPRGPITMVTPDTQATKIPTILGQYNPQITYQYAYLLDGVNSMLDWFAKENSSGIGRGQAIIVFSGSMFVDQKYPLKTIADKAKAMGVTVHTVLIRSSLAQQETLQNLADQTGGQFFYLGSEGPSSLSGLKARLMGIRNQFILTYRSPNAESGTRVVSLALAYGQGEKPALAQYTIDLKPPVAVILSPGNDQSVSPEKYKPTENPKATPVSGIVVTGTVSWPDGHPRNIKQATLLVNGNPEAVLDGPKEPLTFVWNPSKENSSGPVTLQIQIEDELGLTGLSDQIVVRITSGAAFSLCKAGSSSPLCKLSASNLLPYLSILIALAAVGLVVVFRRQVAGTAGEVAGAATNFFQEVGETLRFKKRSGSAKAILVDLDGNTGTGRTSFDLFGTTSIGRSKKNADLIFQAIQSNSPISRLHCTILEEDGSFFVRDDQSANGTYLNGLRMVPMERYPLKEGDEIQLANPKKGGVRLRFKSQGEGGRGCGTMDVESTSRVSR